MRQRFTREHGMKKSLVSLLLLLSAFTFADSHANEFAKKEAMLVLLAGISASNPQAAAVVDLLAFFAVPTAPEYKTDTQKIIAYVGLGVLTLYNNEAHKESYEKEDIFAVNLVLFNIILGADLLGLNDSAQSNLDGVEQSSQLNLQFSGAGDPSLVWQYRF